jgi:F420-0:gamma-glutamyl ligase
MVVGCITGLVGVALGYAGAAALDQYLRRLAQSGNKLDTTGAEA